MTKLLEISNIDPWRRRAQKVSEKVRNLELSLPSKAESITVAVAVTVAVAAVIVVVVAIGFRLWRKKVN